MSGARDKFASIRASVGSAPWQGLGQRSAGAGGRDAAFARARPRRVELTERYAVRQQISRSPSAETSAEPTGHIHISVPYDGHTYFTRQACADVDHATRMTGSEISEARIGHLLLDNDGETDLRGVLKLREGHGSVPVTVRLPAGPDVVGQLAADGQTCVLSEDYKPNRPEVIPCRLSIEVLDPDSLDLPPLDLAPGQAKETRPVPGEVINKIRQLVDFKNSLLLQIVAHLDLPDHPGQADAKPVLTKLAIDWPTITSLRTLNLEVDGESRPVAYSPIEKRIEWRNVPMTARNKPGDKGGMLSFASPVMNLFIEQPGELYREKVLSARAEIKVTGYLLSGVGARWFGAAGQRSRTPDPKRATRLSVTTDLTLDDAFIRRSRSPYHHLFFDEIIPDEMRITDIKTALRDRGFSEPVTIREFEFEGPDGPETGQLKPDNWFLVARRPEGPNVMDLWLFVEGNRFDTERERTLPGHKYKSTFESGELRVFIRGCLPRDSHALTREMNALQQALRERYERVRQRR
jgi:hypothetical protein